MIPFIELTEWTHDRLYQLKGEIVSRGVKAITGFDMPVFDKCRFQHGAAARSTAAGLFPANEVASKYGAGVERDTTDPKEAYARFSEDRPVPCPPEFPPGSG